MSHPARVLQPSAHASSAGRHGAAAPRQRQPIRHPASRVQARRTQDGLAATADGGPVSPGLNGTDSSDSSTSTSSSTLGTRRQRTGGRARAPSPEPTSSEQEPPAAAETAASASPDAHHQAALQRAYDAGYQAGLAAASRPPAAPSTQESVQRSAVKGLTWRLFSTTYTVCIAAVILGDAVGFDDALQFGVLDFMSKFVLFFLHERIWALAPLP